MRVYPVHAGVDQFAEVAHLLAEPEYLVHDLGDLVVVGDEEGARDAPVGGIGGPSRAALALGVIRPVARHPVREQKS